MDKSNLLEITDDIAPVDDEVLCSMQSSNLSKQLWMIKQKNKKIYTGIMWILDMYNFTHRYLESQNFPNTFIEDAM